MNDSASESVSQGCHGGARGRGSNSAGRGWVGGERSEVNMLRTGGWEKEPSGRSWRWGWTQEGGWAGGASGTHWGAGTIDTWGGRLRLFRLL